MNDPKGMGWDRDLDPMLYDLYAKKLPMRGWAGAKSPEEKAYIKRIKEKRSRNRKQGVSTKLKNG
jgi:hypothetical protein